MNLEALASRPMRIVRSTHRRRAPFAAPPASATANPSAATRPPEAEPCAYAPATDIAKSLGHAPKDAAAHRTRIGRQNVAAGNGPGATAHRSENRSGHAATSDLDAFRTADAAYRAALARPVRAPRVAAELELPLCSAILRHLETKDGTLGPLWSAIEAGPLRDPSAPATQAAWQKERAAYSDAAAAGAVPPALAGLPERRQLEQRWHRHRTEIETIAAARGVRPEALTVKALLQTPRADHETPAAMLWATVVKAAHAGRGTAFAAGQRALPLVRMRADPQIALQRPVDAYDQLVLAEGRHDLAEGVQATIEAMSPADADHLDHVELHLHGNGRASEVARRGLVLGAVLPQTDYPGRPMEALHLHLVRRCLASKLSPRAAFFEADHLRRANFLFELLHVAATGALAPGDATPGQRTGAMPQKTLLLFAAHRRGEQSIGPSALKVGTVAYRTGIYRDEPEGGEGYELRAVDRRYPPEKLARAIDALQRSAQTGWLGLGPAALEQWWASLGRPQGAAALDQALAARHALSAEGALGWIEHDFDQDSLFFARPPKAREAARARVRRAQAEARSALAAGDPAEAVLVRFVRASGLIDVCLDSLEGPGASMDRADTEIAPRETCEAPPYSRRSP